jgi:signal peptidase I
VIGRPTGSTEPADAAATAQTESESPRSRGRRRSALGYLHEVPVLIALALLLAILLKTFVVQAFFIPSGSMEPTLDPGDRVLVQKVVYGPDRGDVIVFSDPQGAGPSAGSSAGSSTGWPPHSASNGPSTRTSSSG